MFTDELVVFDGVAIKGMRDNLTVDLQPKALELYSNHIGIQKQDYC